MIGRLSKCHLAPEVQRQTTHRARIGHETAKKHLHDMNDQPPSRGTLLSIVELGGYPNFTSVYAEAGYQVVMVRSLRKALAAIKKHQPKVIVAEFNFQSDFRDRTSNLESLLAAVQRQPHTKIIVFYESQYSVQFERLRSRFSINAALAYPIEVDALRKQLDAMSA